MSTVVLMYHRVGPEAIDPHGIRVRTDRFAGHLDVITRAARVVPLADVVRPDPAPRVAITFDDGYADNLHVAEPMLRERGLPATVFVTAGLVTGAIDAFWQDRLAALLLDGAPIPAALSTTVAGRPLWADLRSAHARELAYRALHARLRRCHRAEIERSLAAVHGQLGATPDGTSLATPAVLDAPGVRALAATGVEIGSHTVHHAWLAGLDPAAQEAEIAQSRTIIEEAIGIPVRSFAYPFGVAEAFDDVSARAARAAGYALAVTGVAGRVRDRPDPMRVPRCFVGDWEPAQFAQRLERWLGH